MFISICRAKIKGGVITAKELYYDGSISIDLDILQKAGIRGGDMVEVLNLYNGARISTYIIEGTAGSGEISPNGPAARFFEVGDAVTILATALVSMEERNSFSMKIISLDKENRIIYKEA
jgi:aspartate 1-decarboxylase